MKTLLKVEVSPEEKKVIELIRNIGFGEMKVIIQDKKPIRVEQIKKSIKL